MSSFSKLLEADAGWGLTLYPEAGEAGGSFRYSARRVERSGLVVVARGSAADPVRARVVADARARRQVRRYAAANRLDRLGTLTYRPPGTGSPHQVREDVSSFIRRLRTERGGSPFPYVWVPERHKSGLFHLHIALGEYVPRGQIEDAWGHGFVSIKRLTGAPVGASKWEGSRIAARYLSKYIGKSFAETEGGLHRYEVGQGFQPSRMGFHGRTANEVLRAACEVMGESPSRSWSSDSVLTWEGPPSRWFQWG